MEEIVVKPVVEAKPEAFFKTVRKRFKFSLYLFFKLPAAFFSGVRLENINEESCEVTIPFKWFSQNPFRSTYFACLSMAGELSTGALGMAHTYESKPTVSMLVVKIEGDFFKKATGISRFVCNDGLIIKEAIASAVATGDGKSVVATSVGTDEAGEKLAEFRVTWSFKVRY